MSGTTCTEISHRKKLPKPLSKLQFRESTKMSSKHTCSKQQQQYPTNTNQPTFYHTSNELEYLNEWRIKKFDPIWFHRLIKNSFQLNHSDTTYRHSQTSRHTLHTRHTATTSNNTTKIPTHHLNLNMKGTARSPSRSSSRKRETNSATPNHGKAKKKPIGSLHPSTPIPSSTKVEEPLLSPRAEEPPEGK